MQRRKLTGKRSRRRVGTVMNLNHGWNVQDIERLKRDVALGECEGRNLSQTANRCRRIQSISESNRLCDDLRCGMCQSVCANVGIQGSVDVKEQLRVQEPNRRADCAVDLRSVCRFVYEGLEFAGECQWVIDTRKVDSRQRVVAFIDLKRDGLASEDSR